jgi:hypothetical protein
VALPVVNGVAIDVPEQNAYVAFQPDKHPLIPTEDLVERIFSPGAIRSGLYLPSEAGPLDENDETAEGPDPLRVVPTEPTIMAFLACPCDPIVDGFGPALPAANTMRKSLFEFE